MRGVDVWITNSAAGLTAEEAPWHRLRTAWLNGLPDLLSDGKRIADISKQGRLRNDPTLYTPDRAMSGLSNSDYALLLVVRTLARVTTLSNQGSAEVTHARRRGQNGHDRAT